MAKIGIDIEGIDFLTLQAYIVAIEEMGYDSAWKADNIIWKEHLTGEQLPVYEAWASLAAFAALTSRIRLGSLVTPCRRRHPALLAKMISTVDIISHGRVNVGLGTGDVESHFELWGMPLLSARERIDILREEINILKMLWTEESVSFEGKHYTLANAVNNPQPVQTPHPPILLGLVLGRTLMPKLIAESADILNIYTRSDVAAKEHLDKVEYYCNEIGRDFSTIERSRSIFVAISKDGSGLPTVEQNLTATLSEQAKHIKTSDDSYEAYKRVTQRHVIGTPEQVTEQLIDIVDIGFDHIIMTGLDDPTSLELFAKEVLPVLQAYPSR